MSATTWCAVVQNTRMDARQLRLTLALANPFKEGDLSIGGTRDERVRDDARRTLAAMTLRDLRTAIVDDEVTASLHEGHRRVATGSLDAVTVGQMKADLLGRHADVWARRHRDELTSEAIAAIAKLMTDDELSHVARNVWNPLPGTGVTIGSARHFGSRIQPNSPGDREDEILFSMLEGLAYGCGDVIIGLNPAADELDEIVRLEELLQRVVRRLALPTRYCVLSDIVKQHAARRQTRVDVGFQSLAGTSRALAGMVGLDVAGIARLAQDFDGLYFETGQGAEVTNGAAEDVDMVTLESRSYGVARQIQRHVAAQRGGAPPWMIVNDVAGFIGPEVFRSPGQLERACLEDMVMAKLHGLTMGLDVCATFHMGITPDELRALTARIVARAAPAYLMAVAGNADPMLGYLTTSFREHPELRAAAGREMTSSMAQHLAGWGMGGDAPPSADTVAGLYARYMQAGGDRRSTDTLESEGGRRVAELREGGFDLGVSDAVHSQARVSSIYEHARRVLYATLEPSALRDACDRYIQVATTSRDRDDYLTNPATGERLRAEDAQTVRRLAAGRAASVQFVISDGLNADAVNQQLPEVLPAVRRLLRDAGFVADDTALAVRNGRVRVGYEIGSLVHADVIVHLIGERPGTGLNALSAYLTFGRDEAGQPRWSRDLDHAATTAICGVHPKGKPPQAAAAEIARTVVRMLEQRRSGVALR